ncbi:MAG: Ppx/GppA family phosphatase [Actinobacteria bacterium]|nr:Ppx/GppA family phosphatase [Actinomycetota bacterium]MTH92340.1 Ppx/GppA family phosphatase [Actinomycetota bacterium]
MRLGVLDVGSNTIHLQVMDAHIGARPSPTTNFKVELRLTQYLNKSGTISIEGIKALHEAIASAVAHAHENSVDEILAFATSAVREAKNGPAIIEEINERHQIDLQILTGDEEARMTFLAVRRWLGWSAGKLLVLDIGGGSLEIATGVDENPEATLSLPLGAARMTRDFLSGDPYSAKDVKFLQDYVASNLEDKLPAILRSHDANHFVATSKTFRTLARLSGHWFNDNPKYLELANLEAMTLNLAGMTDKARADLPGVSASRAQQIVAGAIVAHSVMAVLDIDRVEICPWALREGVVLRRLDWLQG